MNSGIGIAVIAILGHMYKASALFPAPQNVTLETLNTRYVLTWAWNPEPGCPANRTATFTAQYLPMFELQAKRRDWKSACHETANVYCDFTSCELHYLGVYVLRVRASCAGENSKWFQLEFCPDKQALLGPPSKVEAVPGFGLLELHIYDPLTSKNTSMKELYPDLYYLILYWKDTLNSVKDYGSLNTSINVITLRDLEPWTVYCFKVQSRFNFYNKISSFSETQCQRTTGRTPLWQILLWFLGSLVLCFLCVLLPSYCLLRFYWLIKATIWPSYQYPENIQEYLYNASPDSDQPRLLLTPDLESESEVEVCCSSLVLSPIAALPEIRADPGDSLGDPDPESDPDQSRHSRQGSGDSGVYSTTEEGSGGQTTDGSVTGAEPARERVRMVDIRAESRTEDLHVTTRVWVVKDILEERV